MMTAMLVTVGATLVACLLSCVPGLHIYNVLAILLGLAAGLMSDTQALAPELVFPLAAALVVGFSMAGTIPSVMLAAPDESAVFTVLPGQKYLMMGRGYEGVLLTAAGGLMGLLLLVGAGLLAPHWFPPVRAVVTPHAHWLVWCIIAFMLMAEWPKGSRLVPAGWPMFLDGWKTTGAGLLTFGLAGLLGFILFYRSPVRVDAAFQNLMPAFTGLFTVPWLLVNLVSRVRVPPQELALRRVPAGCVCQGAFAGALGGGLAAVLPGVTGGVGGMLAGHAAAVRDDRVFLASQGASKVVYYVGGLMLFTVPGARMTRGGAAWMLRPIIEPLGAYEFYLLLGSVALSGALSFALMPWLARLVLGVMRRTGYLRLSAAALAGVVMLVLRLAGWGGLFVALVATGIGLIPVLFGSRRMNCLAVILVPLACALSGVSDRVAEWLGLL